MRRNKLLRAFLAEMYAFKTALTSTRISYLIFPSVGTRRCRGFVGLFLKTPDDFLSCVKDMHFSESHLTLLKSIQDEWNKAEGDIKTAEMVVHSIVIPSIKELRYAGRRVIDA